MLTNKLNSAIKSILKQMKAEDYNSEIEYLSVYGSGTEDDLRFRIILHQENISTKTLVDILDKISLPDGISIVEVDKIFTAKQDQNAIFFKSNLNLSTETKRDKIFRSMKVFLWDNELVEDTFISMDLYSESTSVSTLFNLRWILTLHTPVLNGSLSRTKLSEDIAKHFKAEGFNVSYDLGQRVLTRSNELTLEFKILEGELYTY